MGSSWRATQPCLSPSSRASQKGKSPGLLVGCAVNLALVHPGTHMYLQAILSPFLHAYSPSRGWSIRKAGSLNTGCSSGLFLAVRTRLIYLSLPSIDSNGTPGPHILHPFSCLPPDKMDRLGWEATSCWQGPERVTSSTEGAGSTTGPREQRVAPGYQVVL